MRELTEQERQKWAIPDDPMADYLEVSLDELAEFEPMTGIVGKSYITDEQIKELRGRKFDSIHIMCDREDKEIFSMYLVRYEGEAWVLEAFADLGMRVEDLGDMIFYEAE